MTLKERGKMNEITHRFIETNGIRMHIAEAGQGPLVLLLHGFPESWYSWRHQLTNLAQAGYHVIAPDLRGFGQTKGPREIDQYTQLHLAGDVIGLLDALSVQQAVVVGHDWGATLAWNLALFRPDRIRGVVGLSVPYMPRGPISVITATQSISGGDFYVHYFHREKAEVELERDVRLSLRKMFYTISGDAPTKVRNAWSVVPPDMEFLEVLSNPPTLPGWLTEQDLDVYTNAFNQTGFRGGLNWYRTMQQSWEMMAAWMNAPIQVPALYIAGQQDLVVNFPGNAKLVANLRDVVPLLKEIILLPGCGHWTQQERPSEVNNALIKFLNGLPPASNS
jgi:pimeloyl-ACP methyl ester carboxylesterase